MRSIWSLLLLSLAVLSTQAQSKPQLTLSQLIRGGAGYSALAPQHFRANFVTEQGAVIYRDNAYHLRSLDGKERILLTQQEWTKMSGEKGDKLPRLSIEPNSGKVLAQTAHALYILKSDLSGIEGKFAGSLRGYIAHDISLAGGRIALMDDSNICIMDRQGNKKALTSDGTAVDIVYGMPVHRNEFGTDRGTLWSPSGRYLAYYRVDRTEIALYPIVDMHAPVATLRHHRYPMAGGKSEKVTLHIHDFDKGETYTLQSDAPLDSYLTNWAWSDNDELYIEHVNRKQDTGRLIRYSAQGAPLGTITTETSKWYVEPATPVQFIPNGKGAFVRMSRKDGYHQLYLFDKKGKEVRQLTQGDFEIKQLIGIDPKGEWCYYTSNESYHIGSALWRVSIKNGKRECLTPQRGTHHVQLSADKSIAIDYFNSKDNPGEVRLIALNRKPKTALIDTATEHLTDYELPEVELGSITAADGTTPLYYKLTRPAKLEKGKRYPVIVYVYGGPHAQLVTDSWSGLRQTWDSYMAQLGYIVFTVDSRGSAYRGLAFEAAIHRQLGKAEMADQMKGVAFLQSLPYVDSNRIGVHGWSYGGFMTTNLMLTHSDTFKVGVAGGPVMDWAFYEVMYGERYIGTPQDNPEGYKAANLIERAGDLKGRLLLIHGDIDPVVVWQHSLLFVKNAVKKGTYPDYMVYPGHEHNVIGPERVHLYQTITRYFTDHL